MESHGEKMKAAFQIIDLDTDGSHLCPNTKSQIDLQHQGPSICVFYICEHRRQQWHIFQPSASRPASGTLSFWEETATRYLTRVSCKLSLLQSFFFWLSRSHLLRGDGGLGIFAECEGNSKDFV